MAACGGDRAAAPAPRRPSMASPVPSTGMVTDDEFDSLKRFHWGNVRPEILSDLEFIIKLPQNPALDYAALGPLLPPKEKDSPAKTLFVDLDETLAHTSIDESSWPMMVPCDLTFESEADGSEQARVYFRPWVTDFLRVASHYFEIVLYTASVKLYADTIIDRLDVEKRIKHRLYREHCTQYGNSEIYFKDLHGTGRRLEDSVVIDNRLISFGLNVENGIFVSSFTGEWGDTELLHLIPLLIALSQQPDVRESIVKTYQLPQILGQYQDFLRQGPIRANRSIPKAVASRIDAFGNVGAHQLSGNQKLCKHMAAADVIGQDYIGMSLADVDGDESGTDEVCSTSSVKDKRPDTIGEGETDAVLDTPPFECITPRSDESYHVDKNGEEISAFGTIVKETVKDSGSSEGPAASGEQEDIGDTVVEHSKGGSEGVPELSSDEEHKAECVRDVRAVDAPTERAAPAPMSWRNPSCEITLDEKEGKRRGPNRSASRHLAALAEIAPPYPPLPAEAGNIQHSSEENNYLGRLEFSGLATPARLRRLNKLHTPRGQGKWHQFESELQKKSSVDSWNEKCNSTAVFRGSFGFDKESRHCSQSPRAQMLTPVPVKGTVDIKTLPNVVHEGRYVFTEVYPLNGGPYGNYAERTRS